jgi:hypothetical protein
MEQWEVTIYDASCAPDQFIRTFTIETDSSGSSSFAQTFPMKAGLASIRALANHEVDASCGHFRQTSRFSNTIPIRIYDPPRLDAVEPLAGSSNGGTWVHLTGKGFLTGIRVLFGGTDATIVSVSDAAIDAKTPAHAAGPVDVTVINLDGQSATRGDAFTFTNCAPHIDESPHDVDITAGTPVTLKVRAGGPALWYQWYADALPVIDAHQSSITVEPQQTTTYKVRVHNECGEAVSDPATVAIVDCAIPSIIVAPGSVIPAGTTATLTLSTEGELPQFVQWYLDLGDQETPILGAVGATYTTPPLSASASYCAIVANSCGMMETATVKIDVAGRRRATR